jgi:DNA polymerase III delta subunit
MVYLLLGEETLAKDKKIQELKAAVLDQPQSEFFDYESLDAQQLTAAALKKSLLALPAFSTKRFILIRHVHKLKAEAMAVLEVFVKEPYSSCDLVLEASEELKSQFKEIFSYLKIFNFGQKVQQGIFDMTKLMSLKKTSEALKMLHGFYDQGMYPLQMMGALVWYWGKQGRSLGPQKFEKGLKALEEADINIKRSRLLPEYALEKLIVELVEIQR